MLIPLVFALYAVTGTALKTNKKTQWTEKLKMSIDKSENLNFRTLSGGNNEREAEYVVFCSPLPSSRIPNAV